ncbi:MAG: CIA30 family protein [Bacteroidota bacterium]
MFCAILLICLSALPTTHAPLLFDFGKDKSGTDWGIINDGVMGGLSRGTFELNGNSLVFRGSVSLANNGGFTSVKSPFGPLEISDDHQVTVRWRSRSNTISMTLETSQAFYLPNFKIQLPPSEDWQELTVPLADFKAYQMGRLTGSTLLPEDQARVIRLGFITEKKKGDFEFEIDYVRFE